MSEHEIRLNRSTVLVVGPPTDSVGGIATVAGQMQRLSPIGRFALAYLPGTFRTCDAERWPARVVRHWRQRSSLRTAIAETGAEIVHLHTCSGFSFLRSCVDLWEARRTGCRVVLHMHGAKFDRFCAAQPRPVRQAISAALARADAVVALSDTWHHKITTISPRANVVVIESAVETPPSAALRVTRDDTRCHFLLMARMDDWKGIDDALAAGRLLRARNVHFTLTLAGPPGSAGDHRSLPRKVAETGLDGTVRYIGPVSGDGKWRLLASADAFLLASHQEGLPIALLEALSCGLPPVATTVGAVPEVIGHEQHGLLVPPRQVKALAAAMERIATDAGLRNRLATAARSLARRRFSLARFAQNLAALYGDLCPIRWQPSPAAAPTVALAT